MTDAVRTGLEVLGGWLACARAVLRRVETGIVRPALRRATGTAIRPAARPSVPAPLPDAPRPEPASGPQEQVEEAKYYLGPTYPAAAGGQVDREEGELPRAYGRDRIILLPRDPWWVFAYWELMPGSRIGALRTLGAEAEGAREVLRVYDVTFITFTGDNAWLSFDVEIDAGADHWYLNVGRPAASFCVELGLRTAAGRFVPLLRSNVVTTPRSSPSPDTTVRWVELGPGLAHEVAGGWNGGRVATEASGSAGEPSPVGEGPRSSDVHTPPQR